MMMSDDVIHLLRLERCVADVAHAVVVAWMDAGRYSCCCPRKPLCRDIHLFDLQNDLGGQSCKYKFLLKQLVEQIVTYTHLS